MVNLVIPNDVVRIQSVTVFALNHCHRQFVDMFCNSKKIMNYVIHIKQKKCIQNYLNLLVCK